MIFYLKYIAKIPGLYHLRCLQRLKYFLRNCQIGLPLTNIHLQTHGTCQLAWDCTHVRLYRLLLNAYSFYVQAKIYFYKIKLSFLLYFNTLQSVGCKRKKRLLAVIIKQWVQSRVGAFSIDQYMPQGRLRIFNKSQQNQFV